MIAEAAKDKIEKLLAQISRRPTSDGLSPHKDVFLLSLIIVFQEAETGANRFPLDDRLDFAFERAWKTFVPDKVFSRNYIELPFWYLQNDGIWTVIPKPGCESAVRAFSRATRKRIAEFIEYGELSTDFFAFFKDQGTLDYLKKAIELNLLKREEPMTAQPTDNSFVSYLNTLQGIDANNLGALAEFQARNPLFEEIRVDHELTPVIRDTLLGNGREPCNVILTGHAGDGKTTLALEVVRSLDANATFDRRTEITSNGVRIVVVKDLSEWSEPERNVLLDEWLRADPSVRYLIVSNTGALLSVFCDRCGSAGKDRVSVENELLEAFDSEREGSFGFGPARFSVHNLARRNNIGLAMKLLGKMVSSPKWEDCRRCPNAGTCPVFANREILFRNQNVAFERISWLYERAHAYGDRLTMRQLGAHFAFFLTGGLDCRAAGSRTGAAADGIRFFNLFWGDDGEKDSHGAAHQLRAVALMNEQEFNTVRAPQEDRLLRDLAETPLARTDAELADLEARLRAPASHRSDDTPEKKEAREAKRRRNYRRAVYFLGTPRDDQEAMRAFNRFLDAFLKSPTLREALAWRNDRARFNGTRLSAPLFRVLQEEFSGIRIPEGRPAGDKLYITLGGRMPGGRRSVQPVLASCESRQFSITLDDDGTPAIRGKGRLLDGVELRLSIPFLDYVHDRGNGEFGRGLTAAYRNRIEAFKAVLLEKLADPDNDELVLLRRGADGSLTGLGVRIRDDRDGKKLEVL